MNIKVDKLDKLFSEYVRKRAILQRGGCEFCGISKYDKTKENGQIFPAWKQLECSHFIGRRKRSTRYDPSNASGVCFSCHQELGSNPYLHNEFFKKRLGTDGLEKLIIKSNIPTRIDRIEIEQSLKELIEEVENG